ncbi:hypothetical protein EVAR_80589_1 [Eumeta japonica]|uniref:Uncharacterized protein n=1 Tax=Eumeta variegata TaxID=151549 RepID=A0A4C1TNQ8_EUMVA|nr:hypothetical protein EVAR_80589_1 [Eumeta japonica]
MRSDHRVCRPRPSRAGRAPPGRIPAAAEGHRPRPNEIPSPRSHRHLTHIENAMGACEQLQDYHRRCYGSFGLMEECGIHGFRCRIRQLSYILT